jgi:hypothetical protein
MKYSGFEQVQNRHLKWKVPDHQWLLWDFNPSLNKSLLGSYNTQGDKSVLIFYMNVLPPSITELVESSWNVTAHGTWEGKWRGNWRIKWVASTLHTTLELGVSSITTADAHTSAASSRLNWHHCRFKWTHTFHRKTKSGSCVCAITFQTQSTNRCLCDWEGNKCQCWIGTLHHAESPWQL